MADRVQNPVVRPYGLTGQIRVVYPESLGIQGIGMVSPDSIYCPQGGYIDDANGQSNYPSNILTDGDAAIL